MDKKRKELEEIKRIKEENEKLEDPKGTKKTTNAQSKGKKNTVVEVVDPELFILLDDFILLYSQIYISPFENGK